MAIVSDGGSPKRWQMACVNQLCQQNNLSCALLSMPTHVGRFSGWPGRLLSRRLYPQSLLPVREVDALMELPKLEGKDPLSLLEEFSPDIIVYLGEGEPDPWLLGLANYGVWFYRCGDIAGVSRSWRNWLGLIGGGRGLSITLESRGSRTGDDGALYGGCFRVKPHYIADSVDTLFSSIIAWPAQACSRLQNGATCCTFTSGTTPSVSKVEPMSGAINSGAWQFCAMLARLVLRVLVRPFEEEQWGVAIVESPIQKFLDGRPQESFRWLMPEDKPRFVADPFGVVRDEILYVFHERLDAGKGRRKGVIACYELDGASEQPTPSENAIQRKVHLSYPFLLQHEGKDYCIPESAEAGDVVIYEAVKFPYEWRKAAVLFTDITIIDPTLIRHDDRWWLFGSSSDDHGQLALNIWYADDLFGPWSPHLANPVKTDVRSTRSAGTPFYHDGHWYRPAQDCSRTYGGRVAINRIDCLQTDRYEEQVVAVVEPGNEDKYRDGLHTLSSVGSRTLVDGKRISYSLGALLRRCIRVIT